jgi:16S rRNA pseudouridine516 synthase
VIPTLMLNKPAGVVSATKDAHFQTVTDLIREPWAGKLFPVGRLDKDTEGLLLLTTDGALSHGLLSPKKHVSKTYFAVISGAPDQSLVRHFREGFDIGEKRNTLPAGLCFLTAPEEYAASEYAASEYSVSEYDTSEYAISAHAASIRPEDYARCGQDECCAVISITEGKFHQIKRMFGAFGREVRFLKRIAMGGLALDPSLSPGEWRPLTEEEMMLLGKGSAAEENRD